MIVDLDRDDPANPLVATQPRFLFTGGLDRDILFRSIEEVVARNKILYGRIADVDGVSHQFISAERPVLELDTVSFENTPESQLDARWSELMKDKASTLDIASGEIVRPVLVELAPNRVALLLMIHHVAFDRGSVPTLLDELRGCYAALSTNQPMPDPPLQYIDLAAYLDDLPKTEKGQKSRAFWDKTLANAEPLALPNDHSRASVDAQRDAAPRGVRAFPVGGEVTAVVPPPVHADLQALARAERATAFMVLMAGVLVTLQRTTGQNDLVVRTTYSLRGYPGADKLIGFVANHLLVRVDASGSPSFRQLVVKARNALAMAWANGDVPVVKYAPHTIRRLNLNYVPLRQGVIETAPFAPGIDVTHLRRTPPASGTKLPYDLSLWLREGRDSTNLQFQYIAALYERPTMEAFIARYVDTLTELCRNPDAPIG